MNNGLFITSILSEWAGSRLEDRAEEKGREP